MPAQAATPSAMRPQPARDELGDRLRRFGGSLLDFLRGHVEILRLDLQREKAHLGSVLVRTLLLVLCAFFTVQIAALGLVVAFWDGPWRLHVIGAIGAAAAIATLVCRHAVRRGLATPAPLLEQTTRELRKDRNFLEELNDE